MNKELISIRAWGDWACFTRPEMKVERVSYPIITPSAARGIFEAIFWEPQMYYIVDSIRVIKKGSWSSIRRNEVTDRISIINAKKWMKGLEPFKPIMAGGGVGTQRNMLALKDVEYIITAQVEVSEIGKKAGESLVKYLNEIRRRANSGKCFHRPCFGVREFAVDFELIEDPEQIFNSRLQELGNGNLWQEDIGLILYDMFDRNQRSQGFKWLSDAEQENLLSKLKSSEQKKLKKKTLWNAEGKNVEPRATFFKAKIKDSIMECNPERIEILGLS